MTMKRRANESAVGPRPIQQTTRVVILGGGFAGVYTARALVRALGTRKDVEVHLLCEENYFVFQPLLPEVAAGGISATHVVNPIREIAPGVHFRLCKVEAIESELKRVRVIQGEGLEPTYVAYDHLVTCLGKVSNFSSLPGVQEHAFAMKDMADAFRLRNHVLRCLELADVETDAAAKNALLTFVVAGGGFSGVETMGELAELVHRSLPYFRNIAPQEVRFHLVHSQGRVLPEMPPKLGDVARSVLERRGVVVHLDARVRAASPSHVYLADGASICARTFICTVGAAPNPVVRALLAQGMFEEARFRGRAIGALATDEYLRCKGAEDHWAVGDCAGVPDPSGNQLCPPTAQFATRQAQTCARNIMATIDGKKLSPLKFKALGSLASLGQRSAVAQVMGIQLTGFIAWFLWRSIYLAKLPGWGRRVRVAIDWTLDLFFSRDITQMGVFQNQRFERRHFEPGEAIVREGQIGREYFHLLQGQASVQSVRTAGQIATLRASDGFGERALLEDTARTATVTASDAVDVLVISRSDFRALTANFPVLDEHFQRLMRERQPDLAQTLSSSSMTSSMARPVARSA